MHTSDLTAVHLFAGLGSMSHALRDLLGVNVVASVEWTPATKAQPAAATLRAAGFKTVNQDVRTINFGERWAGVDLVVGGPPCQPFSQGGRNAGETDERDCIPDFIRAVAEIQPRFFILENVRGLASPRHKDYLAAREEELRDCGYIVEHRVLDASDFGVPQARKRLFILGLRDDLGTEIHWPRKVARKVTMGEALGWTMADAIAANLRAPKKAWVNDTAALRWVFERPAPTVIGSFRPDVAAKPGYRSTGDGPRQNTPGSVSTTIEERLALHGLPKDWPLQGTEAQKSLQLGNTVPPMLVAGLVASNLMSIQADLDEESSASRQHYIDTGRYLPFGATETYATA